MTFFEKICSLNPKNNIDYPVPLGEMQKAVIVIIVRTKEMLQGVSFFKLIGALFLGPRFTEDEISKQALLHARDEIFGDQDDMGDLLFPLYLEVMKDRHDLDSLTEKDQERADGLMRINEVLRGGFNAVETRPTLKTKLAILNPNLSLIIIPMASKVLLHSTRFYVEINAHYTFAKIRSSSHPRAESIISFLYEISYIQQKTSKALFDLLHRTNDSRIRRAADTEVEVVREEVEAIMKVDLLITYLKSSIEKIMALIAETHELPSIEGKKEHSKRVKAIEQGLETKAQKTVYQDFILNFIQSENLKELNDFRTGLLHKKGVSRFQPHSFSFKKASENLPFMQAFQFTYEYHRRISMAYIGALALLTDYLMELEFKEKKDRPAQLVNLEKRWVATAEALKYLGKNGIKFSSEGEEE